jgi:hypothetical protein
MFYASLIGIHLRYQFSSQQLSIETLVIHEFPDATHPSVATRTWSGFPLEAVIAGGKCMKIRLDTHAAELLPALH